MKKFLCYDTNDAASGKINVDSRGILKPNATVPSTNGAPYQQLVTDGVGNTKWEDRLAYDYSKLFVDAGDGAKLIKVSDEVPSWATVDTPMKVWLGDGTNITENPEDYRISGLGDESFITNYAGFITTDNYEFNGVVFPEKGIYFLTAPDGMYVTGIASAGSDTPEITWDGNAGVIKKLDEKFLPDIPADVIEVNGNFSDSIENSSSPLYTVKNLNYSEILSIFNGKNFAIKDNGYYYRPIKFSISTRGDLFVQILVNRISTSSGNMVVAELCCNNGQDNFYRNNYWTIAGTKH